MVQRRRVTGRSGVSASRWGAATITRWFPCLVLTYAAAVLVAVLVLWPSWPLSSVLTRHHHRPDPHALFRPRAPRIRNNATLDVAVGRDETATAGDQQQRRVVWDMLRAAGVSIDTLQQHQAQLPTWSSIVQQYGEHPVIVSAIEASSTRRRRTAATSTSSAPLAETCRTYRDRVPAERRMLGAAGMFSTGTNLVTQLLKHNCYIPERYQLYGGPSATKEQLGIRWQVRELGNIVHMLCLLLVASFSKAHLFALHVSLAHSAAWCSVGQAHAGALQVPTCGYRKGGGPGQK
jgi:hypothetical protein